MQAQLRAFLQRHFSGSNADSSGAELAGNRATRRPALADGPLDPAFWLGEIHAWLPGVFRAGLGGVLFVNALLTLPDVLILYSRNGIWPTSLASGPLTNLSDGSLLLVWTLGSLALGAFALGAFTRVSAVLSWAFLTVVHQRNSGITTGGDYLGQILVFFCVWLDAGAAVSVDARYRKRGRDFISAGPWRAMQVHLAVLYFATARLKVRGGWLSGDGVYLSLQHLGFLRPPGAFLLAHPGLCRASNYGVLAMEGAFAFFALSPFRGRQTRLAAAACGFMVQLGILVTMRVGSFTAVMLWTCVLFLPLASRAGASSAHKARQRLALLAGSAALVALLEWGAFVARRFPLPSPILKAQASLGLVQPFDLFGATYEVARWHAEGRTTTGQVVDVLASAAPGFESRVGWLFSSLYKVTFAPNADYRAISGCLCRLEREQTGAELASIRLWKTAQQPVRPGVVMPFENVTLYEGACPR